MPSKDNHAYHADDEEADHDDHSAPPAYDDMGKHKHEKDHPLEEIEFTEPETLDMAPSSRSWGQVWREYPKCVFLIFGNEFCERFSYYGMRAVLMLYLRNILLYPQQTATILYSTFAMLCYFSPILGSILADGYIGRFHTIMWVSLFYASGNVILAVAASLHSVVHPWLDFIGLLIIGLGTGGIKPCVQPFGADQFKKGQERELQQFFSIFYFAINAGSTISMILTPTFRVTPCENQTTCYPLAFGIPAALMVVAVIFFALGSFWYKKEPPKGNIFSKVAKTMAVAIKNKRAYKNVNRQHWLEHSLDSHQCENDDECREAGSCQKVTFVEDVKAVLRALVVFVPLPIFWALYEQQGSTWVIQATEMNFEISSGVYFLPDQMGVLNAILIMILIPIFSLGIYPLAAKFFKVTPLRKMCVGCFLAGVAYLVCMAIQINIRPTLPSLPDSGQTLLNVTNYVQSCSDLKIMARDVDGKYVINDNFTKNEVRLYSISSPSLTFEVQEGSQPCSWFTKNEMVLQNQTVTVPSNLVGYTILTDDVPKFMFHNAATGPDGVQFLKSQSGEAVFSLNVNYYGDDPVMAKKVMVGFCKSDSGSTVCNTKDENTFVEFAVINRVSDQYRDLKLGSWRVRLIVGNDTIDTNITYEQNHIGGVFTMTLLNDPTNQSQLVGIVNQQAPDNTYSILWQVPQYFVISVAEILFSITAGEFAYTQAPYSMKSVLFAAYLLTDALGNVIILIITSVANFGADMTWAFLIYAILMFVITVVFILISIRYKYKSFVRGSEGKNQ